MDLDSIHNVENQLIRTISFVLLKKSRLKEVLNALFNTAGFKNPNVSSEWGVVLK